MDQLPHTTILSLANVRTLLDPFFYCLDLFQDDSPGKNLVKESSRDFSHWFDRVFIGGTAKCRFKFQLYHSLFWLEFSNSRAWNEDACAGYFIAEYDPQMRGREGGKNQYNWALTAAYNWLLHTGPSEESYGTCVRTVSQGQKPLSTSSYPQWWRAAPWCVNIIEAYEVKGQAWPVSVARPKRGEVVNTGHPVPWLQSNTSFLEISVSPSTKWAYTSTSLLGI